MYRLLRPDAIKALNNEGVKKALGRYVEVCLERKLAKFLICKTIPVSIDFNSSEEELWAEHDRKIEEFRKVEKEFDTRGVVPAYQKKSLVDLKLELANRILSNCHFCERKCGADRAGKEKGFCNLDKISRLSSEFLHIGEEACLVPSHTFFFIGCTFYCVYCQNWSISRQIEKGTPISGKKMAEIAKKRRVLDNSRNVNLVGGEPTPNLHTILEMLKYLDTSVPIVWNSNMYMSEDTMKLLQGCIDVYLADFKYGNDQCAKRLSKAEDYWRIAKRNHLLAKQQAELLIRHLVLPNHIECCTRPILEWIAENFDDEVRVNIMAQYRPEFKAYKYEDISRQVTLTEMQKAYEIAKESGLSNLD